MLAAEKPVGRGAIGCKPPFFHTAISIHVVGKIWYRTYILRRS